MGSIKVIAGIIGGTVAVLVGAYLLSPIATATDSTWRNDDVFCATYNATSGLCESWRYQSAGSLIQNLPLFAVLGIVVTAIVIMVLGAFKD